MRCLIGVSAVVLILGLIPPVSATSQDVAIEVEAGDHDRIQAPAQITLHLPEAFSNVQVVGLTGEDGTVLLGELTDEAPLVGPAGEKDGGRTLNFIVPKLEAGTVARYSITPGYGNLHKTPVFSWEETSEGDRLSLGGDPVLFYVRPELDESTPETREQTYKPFHHLFSPDGRRLSKGAGGLFTHHRGLFFGFNRISYGEGKTCDVWHAREKAFQSHQDTIASDAGPVLGRHRVRIDWHGQEGEVFAEETREVTAYATEGGRLIEFASRVETTGGTIMLDGDPQHAGVHFRADNHVADVTKDQTYYLRPDGKGEPGETRNWDPKTAEGPVNLPWNVMSVVIDGDRYSVAYLDHPKNPKEARYSERDYGRFGSYFEYEVTRDHPLEICYRLWLQEGEMTLDQAARLDTDFYEPVSIRVVSTGN
jgi:hypothetical protein